MNLSEKTMSRTLLQQHNPFGVRDETGRYMDFPSPKEAYRYCIRFIRTTYFAGFVDVIHLMMTMQRLSPKELYHIYNGKQYAVINWAVPDAARDYKMDYVLRVLLLKTGCELNVPLVREVMKEIDDELKSSGLIDKLRELDNIIINPNF